MARSPAAPSNNTNDPGSGTSEVIARPASSPAWMPSQHGGSATEAKWAFTKTSLWGTKPIAVGQNSPSQKTASREAEPASPGFCTPEKSTSSVGVLQKSPSQTLGCL